MENPSNIQEVGALREKARGLRKGDLGTGDPKLETAGAGRDAAEAQAPAAMEITGKGRVIVFAFGSVTGGVPRRWAASKDKPGVNLLTDLSDKTARRIAEAVAEVDAVVAESMESEETLVIPSAVRERAGFEPGMELEIRCRDGRVEIEPAPREVRLERRGKLMVAVPKEPSDPLSDDDVRRTRDDIRSRNAGRP